MHSSSGVSARGSRVLQLLPQQLLTALVTFTRELKPSSFSLGSEKGLDYDRFGHEVSAGEGSVTYMNAAGKVIQGEGGGGGASLLKVDLQGKADG